MSTETPTRAAPGHGAANGHPRKGPLPLFRRALADSWRSLIAWSIGIAAAIALYLPLYPSLAATSEMQSLIDSLPPELINALGYYSLATGAGYTQSTFYGLIGFLLFTIAAVSWGTAAVAGDEESGSLELTLAHGVSRVQLVLERSAAIAVRLAWLGLWASILIIAITDSAELDLEPGNVLAASAALVGLTLVTASVGVAVGALTGRRLYATAGAAGVAVLGYAINAVANQTPDLDWLHRFSLYDWAFGGLPLADGADPGALLALYGIAAALIAVGAIALSRRDVSP